MFFCLDFKCGTEIFFFLDVITESEDGGGILLSILPVTDDLVFFEILFRNIASG